MFAFLQKEHVRPYIRLLKRIVITSAALITFILVLPLFFRLFLPFLLAFVMAAVFNPIVCIMQSKWKISRVVSSILLVAVALLLILALIGWFVYALAREIVGLAQNIDGIMDGINNSIAILNDNFLWMLEVAPEGTEEMITGMTDTFMVWLQSQGTVFADAVIAQTINVTTNLGGGVISVVIFILSCYFITADYPRITTVLKNFLGPTIFEGYSAFKDASLFALGRYLRAQVLLALGVFVFSLIGLLIIGQDFALLLAFILGLIDFLPLVGTAVLLVPWGIIELVSGSTFTGIYLFSMSLLIFIFRRLIEPKVVSTQTGLPPLAALISIYIGMQFMGLIGLILGPIVAMIIVSLFKAGLLNGWIDDINAVINAKRNSITNLY